MTTYSNPQNEAIYSLKVGSELPVRINPGELEKLVARDAVHSPSGSRDPVVAMTQEKHRYAQMSWETVAQILDERVRLRDKNHGDIMSQIGDLSGRLFGLQNLRYNPDAQDKCIGLERQKIELERQLREEDLRLWKDTENLRQILLATENRYRTSGVRQSVISPELPYNGNTEEGGPTDTGNLPGP